MLYAGYASPNQPTISNTQDANSIYTIELRFDNDPAIAPDPAPNGTHLGPGKLNEIKIRLLGKSRAAGFFGFLVSRSSKKLKILVARKSRGFTLAEVLIATAITLLIVTLLFGVFSSVVSQWRTSDQRIDAFRDARAALLLITRDLSRAHVNGDRQMITLQDDTGPYAKEAYVITPIPNAEKVSFARLATTAHGMASQKPFH